MKYGKRNVFTWEEIESFDCSKTELIEKHAGITDSYDTAVPQDFLDAFVKETKLDYSKVLCSTVWVYPKGSIFLFGTPMSAWEDCQLAIRRLNLG